MGKSNNADRAGKLRAAGRDREAGLGRARTPARPPGAASGPSSSPRMHLVENKIPRDWLCSRAIMASPSGKGARAPEAPGCGPQPLARDLEDSVDDAEGLYVAVERCPLGNTTRRRLTCAKCVQSGDFVYFDGRDRERYGRRHGPIVSDPGAASGWAGGGRNLGPESEPRSPARGREMGEG